MYRRMDGDYVYPEKYITAFQKDYYTYGKFNLKVQAPHLAGLAEYYKRKYFKTQGWRDCLKVFISIPQFVWSALLVEIIVTSLWCTVNHNPTNGSCFINLTYKKAWQSFLCHI